VRWGAAAEATRLVRVDPIHRFSSSQVAVSGRSAPARGDRMVADTIDAYAIAM
jgi:hypothetical protein